MASENNIGKTANKVAETTAKAAAVVTAAAAVAVKAKEIADKKEAAKAKVKQSQEKVKALKGKKEKMEKRISRLQMPKGFGAIIVMFLIRTLKIQYRAEKAIKNLAKQFEVKCPLPEKLRSLITKKNRINNSVTNIQNIIQTLQTTTQTISTFLTALNAIIIGIKTIIAVAGSVPLSPSGPFVTLGMISGKIEGKTKEQKSIVEQGLQGLIVINFGLIALTTLLSQIDALISLCLIEGLESGDISEDDFTEILTELNTTSTDSSNEDEDKAKGEDLLAKLQPNSNDPFFYRGFKLQIQQNPNNPLETIPQRRVVGIQAETNILTVATDYSFASTTEVLVNEAKFLIDKWYIEQEPVTSNIEIQQEIIEPIIEIPEPDTSAIDEANAAAEAAANQASAALAEAKIQAEKTMLESQITGWKSDINNIKSQLKSSIDSVNFNKKNKAVWVGRIDSWLLPQQWLGKKGINAYKRIEKKYGNLTGDLNNWFNLNKKINTNQSKIDNL